MKNFILNSMLFIVLYSQVIVGFILKFFLYSSNRKGFLGLHRCQWKDIHFDLSLIFLFLFVLHIYFHWGWITTITKKYFREKWKVYILGLFGGSFLLIIGFWILKI